jgi:2-polyprenyl-6-hydroxyphenyl methylase/3-demethylubiquinone-9 3-methyltransferase
MLRKDKLKGVARSTADPAEIARFQKLAAEWWKPDGAFKVVHAFNAARVAHLASRLPALMGRDASRAEPLAGLRILDVGCGGGLVSEPVSRLGGEVLAIDAAERNVLIAEQHALETGARVRYLHALPEDLDIRKWGDEAGQFDIVLSLEVVEHVADVSTFLEAVGRLVKPGGVLVIGTLNRTPVSFVKAILGAEYIMRWLPRGTHDWRKFVTPGELDVHLSKLGFNVIETCGVELNPLRMTWHITRSTNATYLQFHRRMLATT